MNIQKYAHAVVQATYEQGLFNNEVITPELVFDEVVKKCVWKKSIGENILLDEEEIQEVFNNVITEYAQNVMLKFSELGLTETGVNDKGEMMIRVTDKGVKVIEHHKKLENESKRNLNN